LQGLLTFTLCNLHFDSSVGGFHAAQRPHGFAVLDGRAQHSPLRFEQRSHRPLEKKSELLKPIGTGLKLIVLFISLQIFVHLGAKEHSPRLAHSLNFFSWLVFTFAALRLGLYMYGDLFVVRLKKGSFPAAFKNIIVVSVLVVALILLKEILDINVTSLIATTTVLTATIGLAFQARWQIFWQVLRSISKNLSSRATGSPPAGMKAASSTLPSGRPES
jgi:predicted neutral ceramidase superfamily lipid hydrolase